MTSRSENRAGEAGFTLIELIVVLAILGLLATVVLTSGLPVSPATHARGAAQAVSAALRSARSAALASNKSVVFSIDLAGHSFRWGQSPPQELARDLNLSLLTSRDQLASETIGRIRFDPDGSSSGGRVTIEGGGQSWDVGVDWLSGRVSVAQQTH